MGGKLHRNTAGGANPFPDPVCQFEMVAVTWRQVVAGLGNADDRLAGLQLLPGQAVIEIALEIERGHAGVGRIVKPFAGAEFAPGDAGKRLVHVFSRSAHALILCACYDRFYMPLTASQSRWQEPCFTTLIQRHRRKSLVRPLPIKARPPAATAGQI
jgi:hypothetical protein